MAAELTDEPLIPIAPTAVAPDRLCDLPIAAAHEPSMPQLDQASTCCIQSNIQALLAALPMDGLEHAAQFAFCNFIPEPCETGTELATISAALTRLQPNSTKWRQVKSLPGYKIMPIRKLGHDVFMSFPCFRAFHVQAQAEHKDAHGEVRTISDFTHGADTVAQIAEQIIAQGVVIDAHELDYGTIAPVYHPKIILFMTESWTFKLVQERRQDGAPVDVHFVYAWPGGKAFYQKESVPQPILPKSSIRTLMDDKNLGP